MCSLDVGLKRDLVPLLQGLLGDKVPSVVSCALSAWEHVCPERTDLLHLSYRQICRMLIEMDEWGQLAAMRVLTIYVRRCFEKPVENNNNNVDNTSTEHFYDDSSENTSSLDPDLLLLYKCALQLIHSRSSAVCFLSISFTYVGYYCTYTIISGFSASDISPPPNPKFNSSPTKSFTSNIIPNSLKHLRNRIPKSSITHSFTIPFKVILMIDFIYPSYSSLLHQTK